MSSKLINLYWDYLKKISSISVANATKYKVASAAALQDVLTQDTMLEKAKQPSVE